MNSQIAHTRLSMPVSTILYNTIDFSNKNQPTFQLIPVYYNKIWSECVIYTFKQFILVLITSIKLPYDILLNTIDKFQISFEPILSSLPSSLPELSLRQFTSENILCFVYISNNYIIIPQLMPSTVSQQYKIRSSFNDFLLKFSDISNTGNCDYILSNNNLLFYVKITNEYQLYLLTTIETEFQNIPIISNEIIKNIKLLY